MADLGTKINALIREEIRERVLVAYEHGYHAGQKATLKQAEVDRRSYRMGYEAGYSTGRRGAPLSNDGEPVRLGRPRKETFA